MERFKLAPCQWIVEVNGKHTGDLDTFVDVVKVHIFLMFKCHSGDRCHTTNMFAIIVES